MIDTRLIFVDGMSGSGKSVTAHWLARQLELGGIPARWLHEEEEGHPLAYSPPPDLPADLDERGRKERFMRDYPAQWARFASEVEASGKVTIVDGYLFMCTLMPLLRFGFGRERLESFLASLVAPLARLDPVLIAFWQADIPAAFRLNWARRGAEWESWYTTRLAGTEYAKSRGLGGAEAAFALGASFTDTWRGIADSLGMRRLLIENSGQDWPDYRARILGFLGLDEKAERLSGPDDARHCGVYRGEAEGERIEYRVRIEGGRLRLDAFWPGLVLMPAGDRGYIIEGFPFGVDFRPGEVGQTTGLVLSFGREAGSERVELVKAEEN